jgi:toxin ParE1/3/4
MGRIRRTPTSQRDYADIWDYIAQSDPSEADKTLRAFDDKLQLLSDFPHAGRSRKELRPRLRSFPVGKYMLFYRPLRDGVELVRVVQGARDLRKIFKRK